MRVVVKKSLIIIFCLFSKFSFNQSPMPQGSVKYLNVEYDVYKYIPNKKIINGYKGYLNTGDKVTVVCIPATTRGVLELTNLENQSIYKRLLGYYNTLKDESRCYVFQDELAD